MTDTPAANLPILEEGEYDQYMLREPAEVAMVLRGLQERVSQIDIYFNEGRDLLPSMLVAVGEDRLILDVGVDKETNRRAVEAPRHYCVTQLDKVRIQFLLGEFAAVTHAGRPALSCLPPREVLRLQRREYYRLVTPVARPLKCSMQLPGPEGPMPHEAKVFDISGGGIGIAAPPELLPFMIGQLVSTCRIELPEVGNIDVAVRIRGVFEIVLKNGTRVRRAGCEFVGLPGPAATLVQRYIIKVERERKARETGLRF
jgi:c-di-GMP-binding flagellar brake protein YcgR